MDKETEMSLKQRRRLNILYIAPRLHPNYSDALRALSQVHNVRILVSSMALNENHTDLNLQRFTSSRLSLRRERRAQVEGMHKTAIDYRLRSPGIKAILQYIFQHKIDVVICRRDNTHLLRDTRFASLLSRTKLFTYRQTILGAGMRLDRNAIHPLRNNEPNNSPNYLPLCIDTGNHRKIATNWKPGTGPLRIMAVGKLQKRKGFQVLIDAINSLPKSIEIEVDIYGAYTRDYVKNGNAEELKTLVEQEGLDKKIHFRDFVPQENMHAEYISHHLYIYSGWVKPERDDDALTYGRANGKCGTRLFSLIEAMRAGLPAICATEKHVVGAVDLGKSGLLFEKGNAADLAEKISQVINMDLEAMGRHSRHLVETHYNASAFPDRLEQLIPDISPQAS